MIMIDISMVDICRLRRFPAKRKLLTNEEFYDQGVRETTKALEELKHFCSSPDSKPWKLMTRLKDPQRYNQIRLPLPYYSTNNTPFQLQICLIY